MKSQVDHKVLGNFFDYDQTELDFSEVTYDVGNHNKDYWVCSHNIEYEITSRP